MRAIIQSYTPQECERIINGQQTIKVCKTAPKETPFKVYIYCTKKGDMFFHGGIGEKQVLYYNPDEKRYKFDYPLELMCCKNKYTKDNFLSGKVIGEYVCEKVDKYRFSNYEAEYDVTHDEMAQMWLNHPDLIKYGKGKTLRGLHISSLKIYDKPKKLSEFRPCYEKLMTEDFLETCSKCNKVFFDEDGVFMIQRFYDCGLTRPPHGWQYVEAENEKEAK